MPHLKNGLVALFGGYNDLFTQQAILKNHADPVPRLSLDTW